MSFIFIDTYYIANGIKFNPHITYKEAYKGSKFQINHTNGTKFAFCEVAMSSTKSFSAL